MAYPAVTGWDVHIMADDERETETETWRVWNGDSGRFLEDFDSYEEAVVYANGDPDLATYYEVGLLVRDEDGILRVEERVEIYTDEEYALNGAGE